MATLPKGKRLSAIRKEERQKRLAARERFRVVKAAYKNYERQLKGVAKQVGAIVEGMAPDGILKEPQKLQQALRNYGALLKPWAESVAARLIAEVDQRDQRQWQKTAQEMGQNLRAELQTMPIGQTFQQLMAEQVSLITSLPLKAAERVHALTTQALLEGRRASEVAAEIMKTGKVTTSRAMLIARTEVARTSSIMTEARAKHVGSTGYIWRTSGDSDVRETHRKLEGQFIEWDKPPISEADGVTRAHAGQVYNCRCYPEPLLPDIIE